MAKAEGMEFDFLGEDAIDASYLEAFVFEDVEQYIKTETHEFSAVCPFSGLPDYAYLKIEYYPTGRKCVELKSLKYYVTTFRNVGIYQERCTTRIHQDLTKLLETDRLRVTTIYNIRGGFRTTCVRGEL
ncbi:MAG: NADPH-dependent 7-cyano-7-deazaguanine reductase QueF [Ignavibacteria bacterium]|nr:NADPH-dependent 7-cyano-7-deazaguanine reductase QueF [Ignavibacteria bacterium]